MLDPEIDVRPTEGQIDDLLSEIYEATDAGERVLITTLTKRMAEDLSKYLENQGIRVRYLHSDIDNFERLEIIRDLRLGKFDVLVGINLLREGLDLPEVSLVAILDADKEGFLRTRNLFDADGGPCRPEFPRPGYHVCRCELPKSHAGIPLDESKRRPREIQSAYNEEHGIVPKTIVKPIRDIATATEAYNPENEFKNPKEMTAKELKETIKKMEKEMKQAAKDLPFERAAELRDLLFELRSSKRV